VTLGVIIQPILRKKNKMGKTATKTFTKWGKVAKSKFKKLKKGYTKYRKEAPQREEAHLKRLEQQAKIENVKARIRKTKAKSRPKPISFGGIGGGGGFLSGSRNGTGPAMTAPSSYYNGGPKAYSSYAPSYHAKPKPKRKPTRRKPKRRRRR